MRDKIAHAAISQLGVAFRAHGRIAGVALDCVGLVAYCLNTAGLAITAPCNYTLRGDYYGVLTDFFRDNGFCRSATTEPKSGTIGAVRCSPQQYHLMVRVDQGWVHAHAGLGRVVLMPDPSPWEVLDLWRLKGN
jgi:murein DD-endopeptidase / murein LD-carboxypeptidase